MGIKLSFLVAGFLFLPLIQKLDNGVLHLLCGVGPGEILPQLFISEGDPFKIAFLHLVQDFPRGIHSEIAFLRQLFQPLRLRKGRGSLHFIHSL